MVDVSSSRLNLISCRNLLIYLDKSLQEQVLRLCHYSLRPDGFLFLGSSESRGKLDDPFAALDSNGESSGEIEYIDRWEHLREI